MSTVGDAEGWLVRSEVEIEQLVVELVALSSHTSDAPGATRVAEVLAAAATALGDGHLRVERIASPSGRFGDHLRVAAGPPAAGGGVLLVGHHDTVFPREKFSGARIDGPLLRGPGALDMKGGLVVALYGLAALARAGLASRLPVELVTISDEEVGSPEGRELVLASARRAACALVFESGRAGDRIVTQRKGTGGVTARAHGRASHAGNAHQDGANAIWALARFIDAAQGLTDYGTGITVNVGRVSGGMGKNTVPDEAEAIVDFRFQTRADGDALLRALGDAAARSAAAVPGSRIELAGGVARLPLERTEASARLAAEYGAHARAVGLGAEEAPLLGGGSDANTAHEAGIPAIDGLGPRGSGYHTTDEQIERASLVPKARALYRFLSARAAARP